MVPPIKKDPKSLIYLFLLLILISFLFLQKINLTNSDIGRHIVNGEIFFNEGKILSQNFYSYTNSDYSTITSHWGYGPIVYLIWIFMGFSGLSLLNLMFFLVTFVIFFSIAKEKGNSSLAIFSTLLLIPLLTYRKEVRPEFLSYLFLALYYLFLTKFKDKKINFRRLSLIILPLQILWINIHIFFVFGLAIISLFTLESYFNDKANFKKYLLLLGGSILASLINPHFINGLIYPLTIFQNYGYRLAENMNVFFMQARFYNPLYIYFEFVFIITLVSFFLSKKTLKQNLLNIFIFSTFGILAFKMIRNIPILGFIALPILSENLNEFYRTLRKNQKKFLATLFIIILLIFMIMGLNYFSQKGTRGFGLIENSEDSLNFFIQNNLEGPIFNNYDIGGYLIFGLFPEEKVFTDNRPEAYPGNFFKDIYIPLQENETLWKEYEDDYNFNTIFFNRNDITPWAQDFLIKRIKDPSWTPVYVDNFVIIYLKNNEKNKELIKKFEIPQNYFVIN